jgi:putative nucleotidyltransferase with HDIG domain
VQLVEWAEQTARERLSSVLPRRWSHVLRVAERAGRLAGVIGSDGELLHAAAWVHDVGYAPELAVTGFHPLDGARFLRGAGVPERLCNLVAFHSSARTEAELFGVADQLAEFSDERTLVRDLLWYADMTIGPDGQRMTFAERMQDVRDRYDPGHYVIRALDAGMPERRAAVARAQEWIASVGLAGQV